jgi:hypothetical protein
LNQIAVPGLDLTITQTGGRLMTSQGFQITRVDSDALRRIGERLRANLTTKASQLPPDLLRLTQLLATRECDDASSTKSRLK